MDEKSLSELSTHISQHVSYPISRTDFMASCGNLSHVPAEARRWVEENLPNRTFQSAEDLYHTLNLPHEH